MSWQTIVKDNKLAIAQIPFNEVLKINRLDAEYFDPFYLEQDKILSAKNLFPITKYTDVSDGNHLSITEHFVEEGGVPYFRGQDVNNIFLNSANPMRIPEEIYKKGWMKRSHFKANDILLSIVGTIGGLSFVPEDLGEASGSCKIAILRPKDTSFAKIVMVFLLGKYGQYQLKRTTRGAVQMGIILEDIPKINIPNFLEKIASAVDELIASVFDTEAKSRKRYAEAEQMLLKEINLEGYKGTEEAISVRNFSDCLADNRFDAEYWQPDYDVILDTLSKYKKGVSAIGDEFKQLKVNFKAEKDEEYNYIEIGDVNVSTGEVEHNSIPSAELPANAKIKFGKRQLITSKVRPNRGATAILENHEGYIGSGAFTVLTEQDNINLETLMVYLKARPIRELLQRYNTGTSYPVITDADVLKLPIPLIDKTVQKKISELVSVSARERQQAKELLEKAKRAVEIFVEKDEAEALNFLQS